MFRFLTDIESSVILVGKTVIRISQLTWKMAYLQGKKFQFK